MLSEKKFNKAEQFIREHARSLDQALFNFEFNDGDKDSVIDELTKYQTMDKGFGHALEPDIRSEYSSVIATTVGLQYLNDIGISDNHPMIVGAVDYLQKQVRREKKIDATTSNYVDEIIYFPKVPVEVMEFPRAPWWNTEIIISPNLERWANPNAEVVGYLYQWSDHTDNKILEECNAMIDGYLAFYEARGVPAADEDKLDFYHVLTLKRALPHLPERLQQRVKDLLLSHISPSRLTPANIGHIKPQWLVTEKSSFLNQHYPDTIHHLLEIEISKQEDDGGWHPIWKWGNDSIWKQVEKEWAGKLTLDLLLSLKYLELLET